ncbi:hypothetical protein OROMI_001553 [Orobanche minor]
MLQRPGSKRPAMEIDRSPGSASYSEACFRACVASCGYKEFNIPTEKVNQVHSRPPKPPVREKSGPPTVGSRPPDRNIPDQDEIPSISA